MERITKILQIAAPVDQVYATWRRIDEFPRFLRNIKHVSRDGGGLSRWESARIFGKRLRWQAATVEDVPNTRIRWESTKGSPCLKGLAEFIPADGGCVVLVVFEYRAPLGVLGKAASLLVDVEGRLERDLERVKMMAETGAIAVPARRRGLLPARREADEKLLPAAASR